LKIKVLSKEVDGYSLLMIRDNGIGIDLEQHGEMIFFPFKRIGAKEAEGTGIGLYIVKSIIEKNGGFIKLKSYPGEGTAFCCYLKEY
jgi:signal transduction histidine kinase